MANLQKVHPSCLSEQVQKRRRLIDRVREVACEIEFADGGDRPILARELDRRRIRPLGCNRWYKSGSKNPTATLTRFLQRHVPELLRSR